MLLIKLGGSVITDKSSHMTPRRDNIDRLAREVASCPEEKVIIHGAGSFGHIKAKEHSLHKGYSGEGQRRGICEVQSEVRALDRLVEDALRDAGVQVVPIPAGAAATFDNGAMAEFPSSLFRLYLDVGITPMSFGDVVVDRSRGISICSGDDIMLRLARDLGATRAVFVTVVDGIFPGFPPKAGEAPLAEVRRGSRVDFNSRDPDVTGSMRRKLDLMLDMATGGCEVTVLNGAVPGRLADALAGKDAICTRVRGD
jgi:isopentenyl phosphate kinase